MTEVVVIDAGPPIVIQVTDARPTVQIVGAAPETVVIVQPSGPQGPAGVAGTSVITFFIDGGGSIISSGIKGDLDIPFACTINSVTLLADQVSSVVVDIWKNTYANFPPVVGNSIVASAPPTLSSATKSQDATLTGWTTALAAGDILRFNVNSATSLTRLTVALFVTR